MMISKTSPKLDHYLLFPLVLVCCFLQTGATLGNETDLRSLVAIRDQIQGLTSWNQSFHFCDWQGIRCSKRHGRVTSLNLSNQSFTGSISPHIGNLSFLKFINLQNNRFYGEIPQEIGRLFRLQYINVSYNAFQGEIPINITHCTELTTINLAVNKLIGNIPPMIGSLSKLVYCNFAKNNLTGEIPASFGNLSSLAGLMIGANSLEGSIPVSFARLSRLIIFSVSVNRLSGEVPLSLYNISTIQIFSISSNSFTGSLPPELGLTLPNLTIFYVGENHLSGPFPISLANASMLESFDISSNNFTGTVPTDIGALQNLSLFNCGYNFLGRRDAHDLRFISSLTNSSNLKILSLAGNNFGGMLPNSIANLSTQLQRLYLGGNYISGIIPEDIGNLVNLIGLGFEFNSFHGSIPSSIGNIQTLQHLILWGNNLSGFIPSSLGNITQLSVLKLQKNKLQGTIPTSFGGYRYLQYLQISTNNLANTIPPQIFSLPSLSILLDLSYNYFNGSLPLEVGNLKSLGILDVSGNMLSGVIPSTLGNCRSMEELHLGNNLFQGKIPQSLTSLKNLLTMDLSSNNLSGQIPKYLENFPYLQTLNLSFNRLSGEVPTRGIFKNSSAILVLGNSKLCGGIRDLHLPQCKTKPTEKQGNGVALKLAIGIPLAVSFLLALCFLILCWRRKPKIKASRSPSMKDQHLRVSYRDLFQATGGFSTSNLVGSGSYGRVYKGMLSQDDEMIIAVKVFNLERKGASKIFMSECESLRNVRHRNLVKIITSCSSIDFQGNDFKALVFEFVPNGSLEEWLHRDGDVDDVSSLTLNLPQRLNIAIDVASALKYLHHECHTLIVHRDLKPSNVLLDNIMMAHVSDFGLAKLLSITMENSRENLSTASGVKGSIGYAAPEYGMGNTASTNGDVYSYGVMLLEMFVGRRPTDEMFKGGLNLHNYAKEGLRNQVTQVVDPKLLFVKDGIINDPNGINDQNDLRNENHQITCLSAVIRIGISCSLESPIERMDMKTAHEELVLIRQSFLGTHAETTSTTTYK